MLRQTLGLISFLDTHTRALWLFSGCMIQVVPVQRQHSRPTSKYCHHRHKGFEAVRLKSSVWSSWYIQMLVIEAQTVLNSSVYRIGPSGSSTWPVPLGLQGLCCSYHLLFNVLPSVHPWAMLLITARQSRSFCILPWISSWPPWLLHFATLDYFGTTCPPGKGNNYLNPLCTICSTLYLLAKSKLSILLNVLQKCLWFR